MSVDVGVAATQKADNVLQGAAASAQHAPNARYAGVQPRRSNSNGSGGGVGEQQRRMTLGYTQGSSQMYHGQGSRAGMGTSRMSGPDGAAHCCSISTDIPQKVFQMPRRTEGIAIIFRLRPMASMLLVC